MYYFSHRGNLNCKTEHRENTYDAIDNAILRGLSCEIDVWKIGERLYLGHDKPESITTFCYLNERIDSLLIHCKNLAAIEYFYIGNKHKADDEDKFHYFYHENDPFTLSSHGYIVTFPKQPVTPYSICMKPELYTLEQIKDCWGICSDYILDFKKLLEEKLLEKKEEEEN